MNEQPRIILPGDLTRDESEGPLPKNQEPENNTADIRPDSAPSAAQESFEGSEAGLYSHAPEGITESALNEKEETQTNKEMDQSETLETNLTSQLPQEQGGNEEELEKTTGRKTLVEYISPQYFDKNEDSTADEIATLNRLANSYTQTAEKGQGGQIEAAYQEKKNDLLLTLEKNEGTEKALNLTTNLDQEVEMNRLLNNHPDMEKAILEVKDKVFWTKTAEQIARSNGTFFTLDGAARTAASLALGEFGRKAAKGVPHDVESNKKIGQGAEISASGSDPSEKPADAIVDAGGKFGLATKLDRLLEKIHDAQERGVEEKGNLQKSLATRTQYTQDKLRAGKINFGSGEERIKNQYQFINTLAKARAQSDLGGDETIIERLETLLSLGEEQIDPAKKSDMRNQGMKGVLIGATAAFSEDFIPKVVSGAPQKISNAPADEMDTNTLPPSTSEATTTTDIPVEKIIESTSPYRNISEEQPNNDETNFVSTKEQTASRPDVSGTESALSAHQNETERDEGKTTPSERSSTEIEPEKELAHDDEWASALFGGSETSTPFQKETPREFDIQSIQKLPSWNAVKDELAKNVFNEHWLPSVDKLVFRDKNLTPPTREQLDDLRIALSHFSERLPAPEKNQTLEEYIAALTTTNPPFRSPNEALKTSEEPSQARESETLPTPIKVAHEPSYPQEKFGEDLIAEQDLPLEGRNEGNHFLPPLSKEGNAAGKNQTARNTAEGNFDRTLSS